jgi:putative acetyltransferase
MVAALPLSGECEVKTMQFRNEQPDDVTAIRAVNVAAFPSDLEARLVDALRDAGRLTVSLVAEHEGTIVGHIAFSPVTVGDVPLGGSALGLAPMTVSPEWQRHGVGSALVREGLAECRRHGVDFVVVLGEPAYYKRFGFVRARDHGLDNEYGVVEEFMVLELRPGTLPSTGGRVRYAAEFALVA